MEIEVQVTKEKSLHSYEFMGRGEFHYSKKHFLLTLISAFIINVIVVSMENKMQVNKEKILNTDSRKVGNPKPFGCFLLIKNSFLVICVA